MFDKVQEKTRAAECGMYEEYWELVDTGVMPCRFTETDKSKDYKKYIESSWFNRLLTNPHNVGNRLPGLDPVRYNLDLTIHHNIKVKQNINDTKIVFKKQ